MRYYKDPGKFEEISKEERQKLLARCLVDYHYFCEVVLGYHDMNEIHKEVCTFMRVDKHKSKLLLLPRYTFKSCVITQGYALWQILKDPNIRILIYSDSTEKSKGFLRGIKAHIEGRARYSRFREILGPIESDKTWNENAIVVNWRSIDSVEPTIDTGGVETSKVGMHYDLILFDDVVSSLNVTNKAQMDKVYDCYKESLSLLKPGGETIITGCLTKGSKVKMSDNTYKDIIDVKKGDHVLSYKDGKIESQEVEAMIPQGIDKVYELRTHNNIIKATADHPFLTKDRGFVKLENLKIGEEIICSTYHNHGESKYTKEEMWILGFWFGDGWITRESKNRKCKRWVTCFAYGIDEELNNKVKIFLEQKFNCKLKKTKYGYYKTEVCKVGRWFESLGFKGKAKTKRIPKYVYTLSREQRLAFLDGFISADGHINNLISIEICNKYLIKDIKMLAESCGYKVSNIYSRQRISQPPNSPKPIVAYSHYISMGLKPNNKKEIWFNRIKSIKFVGEEEVYDLTVANTHNFIAESFVVHNTRWHFGDMYGKIIAENDQSDSFGIIRRDAEEVINGNLIFSNIGESSLTRDRLDELLKKQGSYTYSCNPGYAPMLMSDWTYKDIKDVVPGDYVVGWTDSGKKHKSQLIKSKVLYKGSRIAQTVKITFESGRSIICTPDHQWFTDRQRSKNISTKRYNYMPAKVGNRIGYINNISFDMKYRGTLAENKEGWLAGIYDGEGSCDGKTIRIAQDEKYNSEVRKGIIDTLRWFNFSLGINEESVWINGGLRERHRFLLTFNPIRKQKIIESLYRKDFVQERDRVVKIESHKEEEVFSLQTETGNYVVWGYTSKNCLYRNNPVDDKEALFKLDNFSFYGKLVTHEDAVKVGKHPDLYTTCTIDPAGTGGDCSAGTVVGTDNKMNMYILEVFNQHCMPSQITEWIFKMNRIYRFKMLGIETKFFRGMLRKEIDNRRMKEQQTDATFNNFGIKEFNPGRGEGKFIRIQALQPYHERGQIKFPGKSMQTLREGMSDLAYQMIQVTPTHMPEPNDILDSLAYHIPIIQRGGLVREEKIPPNSPAAIEQGWVKQFNRMQRRLPRHMRRKQVTYLS